jgi:serine/threonine protein kinase
MPKIQQYELGKTLGSGAFSKVKYATDTNTGNAFAIKIISRDMIIKQQMEEQLKKEIAIMKMLKHPNIIELTEVLQTKNHIYIVLELVSGGELFDKIVKLKRFDEKTARGYFQQLINGISYCHENGVAHRDLKTENLLLDAHDTMKISDFGLSAVTSDGGGKKKVLQTTCGTPNYVAPEVIEEHGYDGFKADIWSLGVILYVMLAGYLPFEHDTMQGLFDIIKTGKFEYPKWFTQESKNLINKMLVVNPKNRIDIPGICKDPWFIEGGYTPLKTEKINFSDSKADIKEAQEDNSGGEKKKTKVTKPMNAFEFTSMLLAGQMNPLLNPNAKIKTESQFLATGKLAEVCEEIEKQVTALDGKVQKKDNEPSSMKVQFQRQGAFTVVGIEVAPILGGLCHVECRRLKGDILDHNKIFNTLLGKMSTIVQQ